MGLITDVPAEVTPAGQTFDYEPPTSLPTIELVNAPLDPDHRNIGLNRAAYDTYIDAEIAAGRGYTAQVNVQNPDADLILPISYQDQGIFYNYGRLTIAERTWYLFYTPGYENKTSTRFRADMDEVASFDWDLSYSMIERGHVAVAASVNDTYGANYCTAPEAIDAPPTKGILAENILASSPSSWTVLVLSTNDLRGQAGNMPFHTPHIDSDSIEGAHRLASSATVNSAGTVQTQIDPVSLPWSYGEGSGVNPGPLVAVPYILPSPVSTIDGVEEGGGAYLFTAAGFAQYMSIVQGAPWILGGISDIRLVPAWALSGGGGAAFTAPTPPTDPTDSRFQEAAGIPNFVAAVTTQSTALTALAGWRSAALAAVSATGWTKLLTSQFCRILIGNGDSTEEFIPENWGASGMTFDAITGAAHGEESIRLVPMDYNVMGSLQSMETSVGGKAGIARSGFGSAAANTAGAVLAPYLAAFGSYSTWTSALRNKELAENLGYTQIQLNAGVQAIQTVTGALSAGGQGGLAAASGGHNIGEGAAVGIGAGVLGAIGTLGTAQATASNAITMLDVAQNGSFDIVAFQLGLTGGLNVVTLDAWWQSLFAVSGSGVAGRLSSAWRSLAGEAFTIVIAMPTPERIGALISTWKKYGYTVERAMDPGRLDVMTHFSYWKTLDATITGPAPQIHRETIAQAFDRGTTIWDTIAEIGSDVSAENAPVAGIAY